MQMIMACKRGQSVAFLLTARSRKLTIQTSQESSEPNLFFLVFLVCDCKTLTLIKNVLGILSLDHRLLIQTPNSPQCFFFRCNL